MSEDTLLQAQEAIRFCPVCGEESTKDFEEYTSSSGTWTCTSCEEMIEVYLTEEEEEEEASSTPSSLPFILIILLLVGYIYFSSI